MISQYFTRRILAIFSFAQQCKMILQPSGRGNFPWKELYPRPSGSADPVPVSSWEIQPVYAIDVCKNDTLSSCKADNDSVWEPLDQ